MTGRPDDTEACSAVPPLRNGTTEQAETNPGTQPEHGTLKSLAIKRLSRNTERNIEAENVFHPPAQEHIKRNTVVPLVHCRDCLHFTADTVNPAAGIGHCRVDADGERPPWPNAPGRCDQFAITRPAVFERCREAVAGTGLDPNELCDWLLAQADPGWLSAAAIKRWAQIIETGGYPE